MNLIDLKNYLQLRRIVPLPDIAMHFRTDIETVRPLLAVWIGKGKLVKRDGPSTGCKGCCQCDPASIEVYEWVG